MSGLSPPSARPKSTRKPKSISGARLSYAALTIVTLVEGWRLVLPRTPLQNEAIAIWSCLFFQILQGLQIDSDHWRHYFLILGVLWGLIGAARAYQAGPRRMGEGRPSMNVARRSSSF